MTSDVTFEVFSKMIDELREPVKKAVGEMMKNNNYPHSARAHVVMAVACEMATIGMVMEHTMGGASIEGVFDRVEQMLNKSFEHTMSRLAEAGDNLPNTH